MLHNQQFFRVANDSDISHAISKEYFSKAIGHVKSCSLSYGPNGVSRGIATIVFNRNGDAEKAAATYNGVLVDKRPMKVCATILNLKTIAKPQSGGVGRRTKASRFGSPCWVSFLDFVH